MASKQIIVILSFLFGLFIFVNAKNDFISEDDIKDQIIKYITKTQNPKDEADFQRIVQILKPPTYMLKSSFDEFSLARQTLTCVTCRVVIDVVKQFLDDGYTTERLLTIVTDMCVLMEIQTENVCRGAVAGHLPIILYIMSHQPNFKAESFCGLTFQGGNPASCPWSDENYEFQVDLPPKNTSLKLPKSTGETFKIIHLSEIHYDPVYEPFGLAECNEPTCCRIGQTEKQSPRRSTNYVDNYSIDSIVLNNEGKFNIQLNQADVVQTQKREEIVEHFRNIPESKKGGYWGDYRSCDTPWWAVEDGIDHIVENIEDFDLIYHTGDIIDHGVWETSKELITESVSVTAKKMKSVFGEKLVLNALGNHEAEPVNQFAPAFVTDPDLSSQWIYEMLIEEWKYWLPEDTHKSMKQGGFYTILVKPGFRVIVTNNNICYRMNWWIHLQPKDTDGQLEWLVKTLHAAELNGERVHILSHMPAGRTDCMQIYTREYKRIMERFSDIIIAEFNGHTHNDEFKVYYETNNIEKPFLAAYTAGSLTAYSYINPNYKVLHVDTETYEVIDSDVWIYNLTEANLTPEKRPRWFKEYSFRENYKVDSMSPKSLDALLMRMVTSEKSLLTNDYHIFRSKSADPRMTDCDANCARGILQGMTTTELYDNAKGQYLWEIFQANNDL